MKTVLLILASIGVAFLFGLLIGVIVSKVIGITHRTEKKEDEEGNEEEKEESCLVPTAKELEKAFEKELFKFCRFLENDYNTRNSYMPLDYPRIETSCVDDTSVQIMIRCTSRTFQLIGEFCRAYNLAHKEVVLAVANVKLRVITLKFTTETSK